MNPEMLMDPAQEAFGQQFDLMMNNMLISEGPLAFAGVESILAAQTQFETLSRDNITTAQVFENPESEAFEAFVMPNFRMETGAIDPASLGLFAMLKQYELQFHLLDKEKQLETV